MARILIVEDNPANLELAAYLLGAAGHQTFAARDGDEGLRAVADLRPDVVLCDLQMPKVDGYELLRRLRADPRVGATPVVAITAFSMPGDRERALQAGFDGYLSKPIEPETFVADVERLLSAAARPGGAARA